MAYPSESCKKMFCFSDITSRNLLMGIIKDNAEAFRKTESSIIEDALRHEYLPQNDMALMFITQLYNGISLKDIYYRTFSHIASKKIYFLTDVNFTELLNAFYFVLTKNWCLNEGDSSETAKLFVQFSSLFSMIPSTSRTPNDSISSLINDFRTNPDEVALFRVVGFIQEYWSSFSMIDLTYRCLATVAKVSGDFIVDDADCRIRYVNALKSSFS